MAIYSVKSPDGTLYKVQGPDGASDQEVITQAQKLFQSQGTFDKAAYDTAHPITDSGPLQGGFDKLQRSAKKLTDVFHVTNLGRGLGATGEVLAAQATGNPLQNLNQPVPTNKQVAGATLNLLGTLGTAAGALPAAEGGGALAAAGNSLRAAETGAGRIAQGAAFGATSGAGNALENNASAGQTAKSAVMGGALGAGTTGALEGLGLLGRKLRGAAVNKGEDLATRGVNPTTAQATKFKQQTGKDITDVINEHKFYGKGGDQVRAVIEPTQDAFDEIAMHSGVTVPTKTVAQNLRDQANTLGESLYGENQAKSQKMSQMADNIEKKYGSQMDVSDITALRKEADNLVRTFQNDPASKSVNQQIRDSLQGTIQDATAHLTDATGQNLADLGGKLHQLYALETIADKRAAASTFNKKSVIRPLIGAILGGLAGEHLGHDTKSAILGGVAGTAAENVLSNPAVDQLAAKSLKNVGTFNIGLPATALVERLAALAAGKKATQ